MTAESKKVEIRPPMTGPEAYDDCIAHATKAARRQRQIQKETTEPLAASMHGVAASTMESFVRFLTDAKKIRFPEVRK